MTRRLTNCDRLRTLGRQRGVALLVMVTVIAMGASWMMVSALTSASSRSALNRQDNARVLAEAKYALAGWMIRQAVEAGENNPGRLPCPEAAAYIGTANEGIAAGNCTLPAVGRLPWRTLGLPKLIDASGEPLWYAVSPGWALPTVVSMLTINSNTTGQLTLDGAANAAVALVIAPGPALNVPACAGNPARAQARNALAPDFRDYLECENATSPIDASFVTNGPASSFNDQVIALTPRDVLPGLEAAIMKRIEREIVPALKTVYGGNFNVSAATPVYPYAAPFADPGPGTGTSSFKGVAGTYQGLLPFNQTQGCTASASNPRCVPNDLVGWFTPPAAGANWWDEPWVYEDNVDSGYIDSSSCYWESGTFPYFDARVCEGVYYEDPTYPTNSLIIGMQAKFTNVAHGLRALDATKVQIFARNDTPDAWIPVTANASATLNSNPDGSATVTVTGQLPNIDVMSWLNWAQFKIRIERSVIGDHALLDASSSSPTGWFVRNEWYRLLYYATAQGHTAATLPTPACITGTNCLTIGAAPDNNKRAMLLLAGRALVNQTRPSASISNYLESSENTNLDTVFVQPRIDASVNDRAIVVDQN